MKIRKDKNLSKEEEKVVALLEEKGLVKISQDEVTLTRYGKIITVMGYDSVIRAEEMEKNLSDFSSEDPERSQKILLIMFALILVVSLLVFWMYFDNLF